MNRRSAFIMSVALLSILLFGTVSSAEKWQGVDEAVITKIAEERGRHEAAPFFDTDKGDLLLFLFLAAGAVGGFAAGYCWRMMLHEKPGRNV